MATHIPVMLSTIQTILSPTPGHYVDCTFGRGGYTQALLERHPENTVIAIDRDPEAIAWGQEHLLPLYQGRLTLIHERFSHLQQILRDLKMSHVQGILFDLGVSSPQLDAAERGFSFMHAGPLDMRMGLNATDAASFINTASAQEMSDVLQKWGEERYARKIAQKIVLKRQEKPLSTTKELASLIQEVVPYDVSGIHPATRTFQGLRLWVNQELQELEEALQACPDCLSAGGQLIVVSFHSLEDRIVKQFLVSKSKAPSSPNRHLPSSPLPQQNFLFTLPGKQPLVPSSEECRANPRARSARLRYAIRLGLSGDSK